MEGIDRLHQIAEDVGRTVWLRDLGAALSDTADAIEGGMRDLSGYESDVLAWVEKNGGLDAVNERTMPDGMEWPRYEDGGPVMFGDCVEGSRGTCTVNSIRFYIGGGVTVYGEDSGAQFVVVTEPVMRESIKRAKHQVLAADGEPLEAGQTVWTVDAGIKFEVHSIEGDTVWGSLDGDRADDGLDPKSLTHQRPALDADGALTREGDEVWSTTGEFDGKRTVSSVHIDHDEPPYAMFEERQKPYSCLCCYLTHQRPVFDEDGVPIKKGDTVWYRGHTDPLGVKSVAVCVNGLDYVTAYSDYEGKVSAPAEFFTHTKPEPDSWSSVWADVSNGNETPEGMMRRCRALAERGE